MKISFSAEQIRIIWNVLREYSRIKQKVRFSSRNTFKKCYRVKIFNKKIVLFGITHFYFLKNVIYEWNYSPPPPKVSECRGLQNSPTLPLKNRKKRSTMFPVDFFLRHLVGKEESFMKNYGKHKIFDFLFLLIIAK